MFLACSSTADRANAASILVASAIEEIDLASLKDLHHPQVDRVAAISGAEVSAVIQTVERIWGKTPHINNPARRRFAKGNLKIEDLRQINV